MALDEEAITEIRASYEAIIAEGHIANPPVEPTGKRGRPKRTKAHNLLLRLDAHVDDVLRFTTDFSVPYSNNLCERDMRMVKIAQKISGGFRTSEGAKAFLAMRSYISTATKQGINIFDALRLLFDGTPWMPVTPGASP